jgi:hypothetical protein
MSLLGSSEMKGASVPTERFFIEAFHGIIEKEFHSKQD